MREDIISLEVNGQQQANFILDEECANAVLYVENSDYAKAQAEGLTEKENLIGEKLMKAYVDYADGLLDEDMYQTLKGKYSTEREEVISKRKAFEQRLSQAERSVHQFQKMVAKLEQYADGTDFQEDLVKEMVSKIIVGKDNRIELVLKCQDVFDDPLIDEYMGKGAERV